MIGDVIKHRYHKANEESQSHKNKLAKKNAGIVVKCCKCGATNKTLLRNEGNVIDTFNCEYICIDCKRRSK